MQLIFLGTSAGVPTKERNVSGAALRCSLSGRWVLIDCGEGTQHQILHCPLSFKDLDAICITHVHGDHCYGLPGILASASMAGRKEPLKVIAPKGIQEMLAALMQYTDMYMGYDVEFIATESLLSESLPVLFDVDCIRLSHRVPSYAYRFIEAGVPEKLDVQKLERRGIPRGPLWGQLQQQGYVDVEGEGERVLKKDFILPPQNPRQIIVAGDNDSPCLLAEACKYADVLVHEATYTQEISDKVGPAPMHSSALQVAKMADSVGLKNLVLTHFSARYRKDPQMHGVNDKLCSIKEIQDEAQAAYSGELFLANDLDHYELSKGRALKYLKNYGQ